MLNSTDRQILKLYEILKSKGAFRFDTEFCDSIGMLKQNFTKLKNHENHNNNYQHFTSDHFRRIGEVYQVDMNFIFGFTDEPFRKIYKQKVNKIT